MEKVIRKAIMELIKNDNTWTFNQINERTQRAVEVIEKNIALGKIQEVNDKVIDRVAFLVIDECF